MNYLLRDVTIWTSGKRKLAWIVENHVHGEVLGQVRTSTLKDMEERHLITQYGNGTVHCDVEWVPISKRKSNV